MNAFASLLSVTSSTSPAVKKLLGWKQVIFAMFSLHKKSLCSPINYRLSVSINRIKQVLKVKQLK
jgi:hypothetical protein